MSRDPYSNFMNGWLNLNQIHNHHNLISSPYYDYLNNSRLPNPSSAYSSAHDLTSRLSSTEISDNNINKGVIIREGTEEAEEEEEEDHHHVSSSSSGYHSNRSSSSSVLNNGQCVKSMIS
ncbi:hypothetical protein F8388_018132 [Cannabis sativa]|uniref:Uncharacterized protein n=1 Tax=Cannabis sativa TaxID=3483 RepID=A0A7J6HMJ2_CANSA|nr:hypothetical protein F8388_018132 [Cannabis sativa]